jgi:hypothetical protein
MLPVIIEAQKTKRNLIMWLGLFILVFGLYTFFDILAFDTYQNMINELGVFLVGVHIGVNLILALLTSSMLSLTQINLKINKKEPTGSTSIPFFAFIFGLLTFGCTPCVIAFLAAIGIAFTPITFSGGNLLWKFILLGLILISYAYILYSIHHTTCKAKIPSKEH